MKLSTEQEALLLDALRPFASRIAVFGSMARSEATEASDLDVLVRLRAPGQRPPLGLAWFALQERLGEQLARPVDLVTERALSPRLRPFVERDLVVLYED